MKITLCENALAQMLASVVDAFPKECFGYLLGNKYNSTFKLNSAYNMSSLRRGKDYVFYKPNKVEKLEEIIEKICKRNTKFLGTYHSHPDSTLKLSGEDKEKNLKNEKLQIIVSIKKTNHVKNYLKRSKNKKEIYGIINNYYFNIGEFYYNENEQEFKRTLFCPLSKSLIDRINS
ncbi:MAG: Mov34/MPN/PAD-1 family protein [Nanoarchaeota archaeon]|nr:Mov34/MPN/PAD-1 family protein [Nanoarchaeota archaeon]